MFLLQLERRARGGQVLRCLLAFRLQLLHGFLQRADFAGENFILLAQTGNFRGLFARAGIFQFLQFRLRLPQLLLRVAQIRQRRVPRVVGAEEKNFRGQHQRQARPGKPAFGNHGDRSCRVFKARRQTRNEKENRAGRN